MNNIVYERRWGYTGTRGVMQYNRTGSVGTFKNGVVSAWAHGTDVSSDGSSLTFSDANGTTFYVESWHGQTWQTPQTTIYFDSELDGPPLHSEIRLRVASNAQGSNLWASLAIHGGTALTLGFWEETAYVFTYLSGTTHTDNDWGSWNNWLKIQPFTYVGGTGSFILQCGSVYPNLKLNYTLTTANYDDYAIKSDFGSYTVQTFKPAIFGSTGGGNVIRINSIIYSMQNNNMPLYGQDSTIKNKPLVNFIGTAKSKFIDLEWGSNPGLIGWSSLGFYNCSKVSEYGFQPLEFRGFSSEAEITMTERGLFQLMGTLGGSVWADGTFELADENNLYFSGKANPSGLVYDYRNKTARFPARSILQDKANLLFTWENNSLLPSYVVGTLSGLYGDEDGTFSFKSRGDDRQILPDLVSGAYVFSSSGKTDNNPARITKLHGMFYNSEEQTTQTVISFDSLPPWMTIGKECWIARPWPRASKLIEHSGDADYFLLDLLSYGSLNVNTTSIEYVAWRDATRNIPWNGIPRYYGGESYIDMLNDLLKALNTSWTVDAWGEVRLYNPQISSRNFGTLDLSDAYQNQYEISFTSPHTKIDYSFNYDPVNEEYEGRESCNIGSLFYGQSIEITSPWFGNRVHSLVGAVRATQDYWQCRPILTMSVDGSLWGSILAGGGVTLTGFGSVLPTSWVGTMGGTAMNLTSGIVTHKTYDPATGMMELGIIAASGINPKWWGSSIVENGSRWWR